MRVITQNLLGYHQDWPRRRRPHPARPHCTRTFTTPVDGTWGSDHFEIVAELSIE